MIFVKKHYGIDVDRAYNNHKKKQSMMEKEIKKMHEKGDVPMILMKTYADPKKVSDVGKLQEMCLDL